MTYSSLRLRLVAGGMLAILLALGLAGAGLSILFQRHVSRTIAEDLDVHLKQLLAGLDTDPDGQLTVTKPPADPRFAIPLSGLYWQISDDRSQLLRSRSLWDATLALPRDDLPGGEVHQHELPGPGGARLLVLERSVILSAPSQPIRVRVAVAIDLARIARATSLFTQDLVVALTLLALVLVVATSVQVSLGLRPLDVLRRQIADIRTGRSQQLQSTVPVEVRPLVDELNALLEALDKEIERSRGRAADLAHGLKTPLAALSADVERLREAGQVSIARDIEQVGDAMSRHVDRELARARVRGGAARNRILATEVLPLVQSLAATLTRARPDDPISFEMHIPVGLTVPFDRTDLAEVLGNLLENAARHARTHIRISAAPGTIVIEDDGRGIAPQLRSSMLQRGRRLDMQAHGAGLGLAIVQDVLEAYGWTIDLADSQLGGLKASISRNKITSPAPPADAQAQT